MGWDTTDTTDEGRTLHSGGNSAGKAIIGIFASVDLLLVVHGFVKRIVRMHADQIGPERMQKEMSSFFFSITISIYSFRLVWMVN